MGVLLEVMYTAVGCPYPITSTLEPINPLYKKFVPKPRFYAIQNGLTKCLNSTSFTSSGAPKCQYNYPFYMMVEAKLHNINSETTCALALGIDKIDGTVLSGEVLPEVSRMRYVGSRIMNAFVIIRDIDTGRILRKLPEFEFEYSEEASGLASSLQTPVFLENFNATTLLAFKSTVSSFNVDSYVFDYRREVPFVVFSTILTYEVLGNADGQPVGSDKCETFDAEQFFSCSERGLNDWNYNSGTLRGRSFLSERGVLPTTIRVAMGEVNADGDAVATSGSLPFDWVNTNKTMVSGGICTSDTCGDEYVCNSQTQRCVQCESNLICTPFGQAQSPGLCKNTLLCEYTPGNKSDVPASRPSPYNYDVCNCKPYEVCSAGTCVECISDANCTLDFTVKGSYTAVCNSDNTCSFTFPKGAVPVESIRGQVVLITLCSIAGVCCIGCILAAFFCYRRRQKNIEADNLMGDELGKEQRKGKEKRFTFSDL